MKTTIQILTLFLLIFQTRDAIAAERLSRLHAESTLAVVPLSMPYETFFENVQLNRKTVERYLGRKLGPMERVGLWLAGKKMKRAGRQMAGKRSEGKANAKVLVIIHQPKNKIIQRTLPGQKIEFMVKDELRPRKGTLLDFEGESLVIGYEGAVTETIPVRHITKIKKQPQAENILSIAGVIIIIIGIATIARGRRDEKSATSNTSTDLDGCASAFAALFVAATLIAAGSVILAIGALILIVGLLNARRFFNVTEGSVWKAEINETPDEIRP